MGDMKINPVVLGEIAGALSNDKYPVGGSGYTISEGDKQRILTTISDRVVEHKDGIDGVVAAIEVFERQYAAAKPSALAPWAKQNQSALRDIKEATLRLNGTLGDSASARAFERKAKAFESSLGLRDAEQDVTGSVEYRHEPTLGQLDERKLRALFPSEPDYDKATYATGAEAVTKFLKGVQFTGRPGKKALEDLLADKAIKGTHLLGSWEGKFGEEGNADWRLVVDFGKGHLVSICVADGWA